VVLVDKKVGYTWIHNHKKMLSTWTHAHRVNKFGYLTLKQAKRSIAKVEWDLFLLLICGFLKTFFLT
jgi:hypothetical protein